MTMLRVVGVFLDLGAEALHVHVHESGVGLVVVSPDLFEQHLAGEDLLRFGRQCEEEVELERREPDAPSPRRTSWPATSTLEVADARACSRRSAARARSRVRMRATSSFGLNGFTM